MRYKEVVSKLGKDWVLVRTKGSHRMFKNIVTNQTIAIPYHGGKDLSIGVIKSIEKATGVSLI